MDALLLLLLDSRSPAGAHSHSSGMEPAIVHGLVHDLVDVEQFCRTRLRTAGLVAADFAANACALGPHAPTSAWHALDAEFEARMPSEALRAASRQLGKGLRRLVCAMLPGCELPAVHHPLVLGAAVAAAGGTPDLAARAAALGTITVPASAAVRLLGLDPFAVQAMLARLACEIAAIPLSGGELRADSAPALDLLADLHHTAEVRLFAS
ncbi:MAG TPA: urease accessory UreF family protein [Mycobacteriales bacterium]|jgi:urease accessory protein